MTRGDITHWLVPHQTCGKRGISEILRRGLQVRLTRGSAAPLPAWVQPRNLPCRQGSSVTRSVAGGGKGAAAKLVVGLTDQTLSCAAKARVPKPQRRAACTYVSRAMQAA